MSNPVTKQNLQRVHKYTLDQVQHIMDRDRMARLVERLVEYDDQPNVYFKNNWPAYIVPSDNLYDYGRSYFAVTLEFTPEEKEDTREAWRLRARKIADARLYFKIKKLDRHVASDGSVTYSGKGRLPYEYDLNPDNDNTNYSVTINVPSGGLPPTCILVEEEVTITEPRTYKRYKTVCQ